MPKAGLRVGVAFGGRSVEHDVSILTGLQAVEALSERHLPVPIYIDRTGAWRAGSELRELSSYRDGASGAGQEVLLDIPRGRLLPSQERGGLLRRGRAEPIELDVVVLATHGTEGEDGCLQGALELAGLPYVGPTVGAAAAAMDKLLTKAVLSTAGLPVAEWMALRRESFERDPAGAAAAIEARFELPVYVKPATLGSSVGVSRCAAASDLADALTLCFELDRVCLVEPAIEGGVEVNCSVLGRPGVEPRASVCEQPIAGASGGAGAGFLSFEDKYMNGGKGGGPAAGAKAGGANPAAGGTPAAGAKAGGGANPAAGGTPAAGAKVGGGAGMQGAQRLIPAPIGAEQTAEVRRLACRAFEALGCAGVSRVDFLIDAEGAIHINECNTIPGSFSFYLWEPSGLPFADLMDELIDLAFAERSEKARTTRVFETSLLSERAAAGAGSKV